MSVITSASAEFRVPRGEDDRPRPYCHPEPAGTAERRIATIQAEVRKAAELPLADAVTSPPEAYTDPDYFNWEVEHLLKADWMCLAHISQVPEAGDYLNLDLFGEPITIVHGKDGQHRVLSRVCPHRAMDIMPAEYGYAPKGNRRMLVCPYHRWTFDLDGAVKGCPEMHRAEGFNKRDWFLPEYRCEVWHGFIFVNVSGDAEPVATQYADLDAKLGPFDMARMKLVVEMDWDAHANWKVILENWIESYHHLGVHYQTLNTMVPAQDTWIGPEHPHFIHAYLPQKDSLADQARASGESHEPAMGFLPIPGLSDVHQSEWGLYIGYPHFQLLTFSDRIVWYRLLPLGPGRTQWLTTMLVLPENLELDDYEQRHAAESKMLRDFHIEDMQVTEAVQRGLASGRAARGRMSHLEEPVWLIQRWLASRYEGAYPGKGDSLPRHVGAGKPAKRLGAGH